MIRKPTDKQLVVFGVAGLGLILALGALWLHRRDLGPSEDVGTAKTLKELPIISDQMVGLRVIGAVRFRCTHSRITGRYDCLLSGVLMPQAADDISQHYHLTVLEKDGSARPIQKIMEARHGDERILADFPVDDSTVLVGRISFGNLEMYLRSDGRFTAFIWN